MVAARKSLRKKESTQQSFLIVPLIALCGLALGAVVAFGNPVLWTPNESDAIERHDQNQEVKDDSKTSPLVNDDDNAVVESGIVVISEYIATSQSEDPQREINIRLAAEAINGVVVGPGEVFSFNSKVGDTENDERYQLAPIVYGDDMSYARGGGICQVSTSLYIAALKANMEIMERHPHSIVIDYAPIGLDATLVYGTMDLRLRNTSDSPITIVAEAQGQTVKVQILGEPLAEGMTIEAVSRIKSDGSGQQGSDESMTYVVESYRVYKQHGIVVENQLLFIDTYKIRKSSSALLTEGGFSPTK